MRLHVYFKMAGRYRQLCCNSLVLWFCFILSGLLQTTSVSGQSITYPGPAHSLVRGLGDSVLTVKVSFTSVCGGGTATVRIGLPVSVSYIAGSVSKTAGTAGVTISESAISDLRNPQFLISGIAAIGDEITFTIRRKAGCDVATAGKDSIFVTASAPCSGSSDISSANAYNIYAPALSITPPPAQSGVNVGDTLTLVGSIVNGGNGCADTVYFYTLRKAASMDIYETIIGSTVLVPYALSGDTLFYKVSGTILSIDGLLCNSESFSFTQKAVVLACTDLDMAYGASWGADMQTICQQATGTTSVNLDAAPPALTVVYDGADAIPTCANTPRTFTVILRNTGNSILRDLDFRIGNFDGGGTSGDIYYDTASLQIKTPGLVGGVLHHPAGILQTGDVPNMTSACAAAGKTAYNYYYQLPFGTLLMPGDSVTIIHQANQCATGFDCNNGRNSAWSRVLAGYTDQCGNAYTALSWNHRVMTGVYPTLFALSSSVGNAEVPGMVMPGACFRVAFPVSFGSHDPLVPHGYREIKIGLPSGTTYLSSSLSELSGATPLSGYPVQVGDTLYIRYDATSGPGNRGYDLRFTLCRPATGGACGSGTELGVIARMVRDTTCSDMIATTACATTALNYICPAAGPCPDGGATMINFAYGRSNFGIPDNNNDGQPDVSGTIDMTKVELDRYRPGDIMKTKYVANVQVTATDPSWTYMFSEWTFAKGPWRAQDSATVRIYKSGSVLYTLSGIPMTDIGGGTGNTFFADWSAALATAAPGFTYSPTTIDSVVVEGLFKFIPGFYDVPSGSPYSDVASLHSTDVPYQTIQDAQLTQTIFANQTGAAGIRRVCGVTPAYNYRVYSIHQDVWVGFAWAPPIGCNAGWMIHRYHDIYGLNAVPARYFAYEYRPNTLIDTLEFAIPAGWVYYGLNTGINWMSNYGSVVGSTWNAVLPYTYTTGSIATGYHVVVDVKGAIAAGALSPLASDAWFADMNANLLPSCSAVTASPVWRYKAHYVGYPSADSPLHFELTGQSNYSYDTTAKAVLSVQNNTGIVQGVAPQHYWNMQVNNISTLHNASNLWFALEDGSSGINIDSVVLKPSNVVLTPIAYGSGHKIYQASVSGIAASSNQQARIYFKYTSCAVDSIRFMAGYGCAGFPSDPATACNKKELYLKVVPEPSQAQLSVFRQPGAGSPIDLCIIDSTLLIVNSAQSANLVHPSIVIYPEPGLSLVTPIHVEYPLGSGDYQPATVTSIGGGGYRIDLSSHTAIGGNGILGTALANPSFVPSGGDRQAKIKLDYTTSCTFTSGLPMRYYVYGSRPCGAVAVGNATSASTSPVNIDGATVSGTAGMTIDVGAAALSCGATATLSLTAVPVSDTTHAGDTVIYTLPAGLQYAGNFVKGSNCTDCEIDTNTGTGGITQVMVKVQAGVPASNVLGYSFDVVSGGATCGPVNVNAVYKRGLSTALDCGGVPCSSSSVIIGTASSSGITLDKPSFILNSMLKLDDSATWVMGGWLNIVRVHYTNNGTAPYVANTDTIEFFCNSSSGVPFYKAALTKNVGIGASDSDTYAITLPPSACIAGDFAEARIQTTTAAGTPQCLCSPTALSASAPLPLGLLSFKGQAEDCTVRLNWSYASDAMAGMKQLRIERSIDGSQYTTIALLSSAAHAYMDITPSEGQWMYRLVAEQLSGRIAYSPVVLLHTVSCSGNRIEVYPNPAKDQIQVRMQNTGENDTYELSDVLGRVVLKGTLTTNTILDVRGLMRGVYMLRMHTGANTINRQVQVVK